MSRAYRIKVRESLNRTIHAHDRVSTQLELLEVLPREQMAALLAEELKRRGYTEEEGRLVRDGDGLRVTIDPRDGTVTVEAEESQGLSLAAEREGRAYDDIGPQANQVRADLKAQAQRALEHEAQQKTAELQSQVTERLERHLGDLRKELDQAVNRVTGEALKQKAAQLGQIKELTEDPETGSLTIVVEV